MLMFKDVIVINCNSTTVCVCVCVRERGSVSECVTEWVCESECLCVCVCVWECVPVSECACVRKVPASSGHELLEDQNTQNHEEAENRRQTAE